MTYPDIIISSSTPYNFICCKPHPSLIRLGIYFFLNPFKFGVWYIRISTLSAPNSDANGASSEAHDALGDSLVPLSASVRILSFKCGFARRACCSVDIYTLLLFICTSKQGEYLYVLIHVLSFLYTKSTRKSVSPLPIFCSISIHQHSS